MIGQRAREIFVVGVGERIHDVMGHLAEFIVIAEAELLSRFKPRDGIADVVGGAFKGVSGEHAVLDRSAQVRKIVVVGLDAPKYEGPALDLARAGANAPYDVLPEQKMAFGLQYSPPDCFLGISIKQMCVEMELKK